EQCMQNDFLRPFESTPNKGRKKKSPQDSLSDQNYRTKTSSSFPHSTNTPKQHQTKHPERLSMSLQDKRDIILQLTTKRNVENKRKTNLETQHVPTPSHPSNSNTPPPSPPQPQSLQRPQEHSKLAHPLSPSRHPSHHAPPSRPPHPAA